MSQICDYKLKVWSSYRDADHDGYCSDTYNEKYDKGIRVSIYDIPADLPDDVIGKNGSVDVDQVKEYDYSEPHGNGYCGMVSTQTAYRAMIVKNPVTRDDDSEKLEWGHEDDDDYDSEYDYGTDDEVCRCTCYCRRRCRCRYSCSCESRYKNRKIGQEYLNLKNDVESNIDSDVDSGVESNIDSDA